MRKSIKFFIILFFLLTLIIGCDNKQAEKHEHVYVDGECECGSKEEKHEHVYVDGECECGSKEEKHEHVYVDGECECGSKEDVVKKYTITFKNDNDEIIKVLEVTAGEEIIAPDSPKKEGYIFIGWSEDLSQVTQDIVVYPVFEKEKIIAGKDEKFTSLEEAINYADEGDVIYINEGSYEGVVINKSVELRGNNYNVELNYWGSETIINSDIVINSSNVIINGITLTNKAKFTFDNMESDIENVEISYCKVSNSTVNDDGNRYVAPFNLVSNNGYYIKDVTVDNCAIDKVSTGRPMAFYIVDVINISILNSSFYGGNLKNSFNDAIKVDNTGEFGVKGNVVIKNNVFKNYYQYVLWFRKYSTGNYIIEGNYFDNIGQTAETHAAVSFISSTYCDELEINVNNNVVNNGYMLFRIDEVNCDSNNVKCLVNQNGILNSKDSCFVKNGVTGLTINAQYNYYGIDVVNDKCFIGDVDYSNYYNDIYSVPGFGKIELKYEDKSYVVVGNESTILFELYGLTESDIIWSSSDENVAVVSDGVVTGVNEGTVAITASSKRYGISKSIIFEVYNDIKSLSDVHKFILSIMNSYSYAVTAANSCNNFEVKNPYLYSIYRSATNYLFEDLIIDTESYPRNGSALFANNKVEYITIHDTWGMAKSAKGLAEYFQNDITSVHYTVGNDGIYQIVRLTDKAAHAGDSPYRAYALEKTNVVVTTDKPVITMVDGYFAINGVKTELRPYTDYEGTIHDMNNYTTSQLTYNGIRCIAGEDGYYYLGKTYFNETYKTVSNFGGNANSIGIEIESQKGIDFYFNMHRTAKLVAMLLDKFDLTTNDVKMHNYFSGKNCAQLLKNNLKYEYNYKIDKHNIEDTLWDEFLDLCDIELEMLKYSKNYKFEFISSDTSMIDNTGRVINHRETSVCVPYVIKITNLNTNEITEVKSSIIIPSSLDIDQCYITKR